MNSYLSPLLIIFGVTLLVFSGLGIVMIFERKVPIKDFLYLWLSVLVLSIGLTLVVYIPAAIIHTGIILS
jgi:hypothetical protein